MSLVGGIDCSYDTHAHAKCCSVLEGTVERVLSDGAYSSAPFASSIGTERGRSQLCEDLNKHSFSVIMALILPFSFCAPWNICSRHLGSA